MKRASLLILLIAHGATADSAAAKAEALFRQGRELLGAGKFAEACAAFDASQKLDPATTTLFNQADCREKAGQLATAWGLFVEAERQTRGATDAAGVKMHDVAQTRSGKLESRLSKLTVHVAQPTTGLAVMRDGVAIDAAEWNRPLPIDGGTYTFVAKLADKPVWSETVTVANEGAAQTVEVVVKDTPAAALAPAPAPAIPAGTASPALAHRARTGSILATTGTFVLLGGALGFELWGDSTYSEAKAKNSMDLWDSANHKRYIAEGLLVAGIGCGVYAAWLWLHHEPHAETPRTAIAPTAAPGYAGLALQGAF